MCKFKKAGSAVLAAAMIMCLLAGNSNLAYASGKSTKEETIYVSQSPDGSVTDITVTDCLKNLDKGDVSDVSSLDNIENTKGQETYTTQNGKLIWKSNGEDITYQGTTDDTPPIGMEIQYKLDGKSISPEKLAGQSGKVTISIHYENHATYEDEINNSKTELSIPFLFASVLILPKDKFENIEISQGKLTEQGDQQIAVAYGMPGLSKSLDLSGDLKDELKEKLADEITITADVTDFELDSIYTIATSEILSELDTEDMDDLDDVEDAIDGLADATDQLISGSSALSSGVDALSEGFSKYTTGVTALNKGASSLATGAKSLASGLQTFTEGASSYITGAKSFAQGVISYINGVQQASEIGASLGTAAGTLSSASDSFSSGASSYIKKVASLSTQAATLAQQAKTISNTLCSTDYTAIIDALTNYRDNYTDADGNPLDTESVNALTGYITQLQTLQGLQAASKDMADTSDTLAQSLSSLDNDSEAFTQNIATIETIVSGMNSGLTGLNQYIQALEPYNESLLTAARSLSDDATISALTSGASELTKGAGALSTGAQSLSKGVSGLDSAGSKLTSGLSQLGSGTSALASGMQQFKDEGTGKLQTEYNNSVKTVIERFQSLSGEHAVYTTFTGCSDDMDGSVQFIFQTEAIKSDQ